MVEVIARGRLRGARAAEALSARLLLTQRATRALEDWCGERGFASGRITVRRHDPPAPAILDAGSLAALGGDAHGLTLRRVDIRLGGITLVDAVNWYFADRLTAAMGELLTGDTPFGEAIADLAPQRRTFHVAVAPAEVIEAAVRDPADAAAIDRPPVHVFEHRAALALPDGTPIAVVHERYRAVLVG
ncbi:hypothetical protein PQJ75_18940 [Rhodoplanes sp. TEM]|uniref:UTRA domain-containing protein n=1 Tax=Rhodoplanes tepidamans TaxID=200616 RepID=A0ABT5JHR0_RHOTP|nr:MULTISPECIES: hypothetical protein [Rhodoplanes]MDC7789249.1 hypothetical protein [Rhodoplanes tepidamans]MDC7985813.1 hypothetical protein [Rhodoplanes sp. TEM]MDQ0358861.1 hypothetical protein [Rhodoplanes tepidamans]